MNDKELLDLGFKDTSFEEDGKFFREFTLIHKNICFEIDRDNSVDMAVDNNWTTVPNCKTIEDLKQLVKLFI